MNGSDAHEKLVEDVAIGVRRNQFERTSAGRSFDPFVPPTDSEIANAGAALAIVYTALREVTPEMLAVSPATATEDEDSVIADWQAMLSASSLNPAKQKARNDDAK